MENHDTEAIRMEHRLTKIEEALVALTVATDKLTAQVGKQNGRVWRLEVFKGQIVVLAGLATIVAPMIAGAVFFVLGQAFGG